MKITLAGYTHLLITIIMIAYSIGYKDPLILGTGLAFLLLFYYEYYYFARINKMVKTIRIERTFDKKIYNELEDAEIRLKIENPGLIEFPRIIVKDILPSFIETIENPVYTITLPSKTIINISYKAKIMAPGTYEFSKLFLTVSDTLNYFFEEYVFEARNSFTALPLSTRLSTGLKSIQRIIGVYIVGKSSMGLYDLANIREYVPGDDPRKILWKHYARTNKLLVREDYGETRARILVLIDIRKYMWYIGEPPNTLAHIQLRLARSFLEYLVKTGSRIDIAMCVQESPKIRKDIQSDPINTLYGLFAILDAGGGCNQPISIYKNVPEDLGTSIDEYDLIILITNPIALALEDPYRIEELTKNYAEKLLVLSPIFDYEEYIERNQLNKLLARIMEVFGKTGKGLEVIDENLAYNISLKR